MSRNDVSDSPTDVLLYFHDASMFSNDKIINGFDYMFRYNMKKDMKLSLITSSA